MIYTVTLNPSIDYIVRLDKLVNGVTNRTTGEEYYFGGKGINVSLVLAELDLDSTAYGYVAGFTGKAIENGIHRDVPHAGKIPFFQLFRLLAGEPREARKGPGRREISPLRVAEAIQQRGLCTRAHLTGREPEPVFQCRHRDHLAFCSSGFIWSAPTSAPWPPPPH